MKTLIEGYANFPGEHCGSVAMRGLLQHYCGLELPEPAVFGLGSGPDCVYLSSDAMDPSAMTFGRTASMEIDVASAFEIDYREQNEPDDDLAWEIVRNEVQAGRPTMLSGDIFYLDYREFTVHFPGHRFVLLGLDDASELAYIADRINEAPERCSYEALAASRNPKEGMSTHNRWGRFHDTEVGRSIEEATRFAIERCAGRMLGDRPESEDDSVFGGADELARGVAGIRALANAIPSWAEREDARWLASFNSRSIEKFGNGGGNFRRLYAGFLAWARQENAQLVSADAADLATRAADEWTALSVSLAEAAREEARPEVWNEAARQAENLVSLEQALFERLLDGA
jgi:hypothetical protein